MNDGISKEIRFYYEVVPSEKNKFKRKATHGPLQYDKSVVIF